MALHDDLLAQAKSLLDFDSHRPKQASLRRAVSAAYYALFHLLVNEATSMMFSEEKLRLLVGRAFSHTEMKVASRPFANMTLPKEIKQIWPGTIPKELQSIAETFGELQEQRHKADYKVDHRLKRNQVREIVARVEKAFRDWESIKGTPIARIYLASLLLGKKWKHDEN